MSGSPGPSWEEVDSYLEATLLAPDSALEDARQANGRAGLPAIDVSPLQGKLLMLLARLCGARTVLEVGTLGGYSTTWLARGLPEDGLVVSLELEPRHAEVARSNLQRADVAGRTEVIVGPALESLPRLSEHRAVPFDMFFLDADKDSNTAYLDWVARLGRRGSLVVVDNVVRQGRVAVGGHQGADGGSRAALELLGRDERFEATALQTVGSKGWDGMALAVLR